MSPQSTYTPDDLREIADRKPSPMSPYWSDEARKALRWAANVIEAADAVITKQRVLSAPPNPPSKEMT